MPRMRVRLTRPAFQQLEYWTCRGETAALRRLGVLRDGRADTVEIWAAEDPMEHPTMKGFLAEARRYSELWAKGAFQLAMFGRQTEVFKWDTHFAAEHLRIMASIVFGIESDFQLVHLGEELVAGPLVDYGVGPGSTVLLTFGRPTPPTLWMCSLLSVR